MGSVTSCRMSSKLGRPSRWVTFDFCEVKKIVQTDYIVPLFYELFAHVGAKKASSARYKNSLYARHSHTPKLHPFGGKHEIDLILDATTLESGYK